MQAVAEAWATNNIKTFDDLESYYMAQEKLMNLVGVIIFYAIIVFGVIALNSTLDNQSTTNPNVSMSQNIK